MTSDSLRIPKYIHQTWRDQNVRGHSPVAVRSQKSWIKNHPDWEYRLWTDEELEPFVVEHYPWFMPTWRALNLNIKRIDAVRYCWLHKLGGMYADLDFVALKSVEPLLIDIDVGSYRSRQAETKNWSFAGNAWMASVPGHPIWIKMLEHIRDYPEPDEDDMFSVLCHTGPMGLGTVIEAFLKDDDSSKISVFNSSLIGNENEPPVEFAFHARTQQWGDDWRGSTKVKPKRSIMQRVRERILNG
ncbi:MAG: glycosyltransferase [Pseudomonadota bacterium]